jgi:hypothetical protein
MGEFDIQMRRPADPYGADAEAGPSAPPAPFTGFTSAAQWGLASLLIGCTLLVAACVTLVFNILLFRTGRAGIPVAPAFAAGLIGSLAGFALGLASVLFAIWACRQAYAARSSPALGVAGLGASATGLAAWLIAAIDLMAILYSFI